MDQITRIAVFAVGLSSALCSIFTGRALAQAVPEERRATIQPLGEEWTRQIYVDGGKPHTGVTPGLEVRPNPEPAPAFGARWYGYQLLLSDVAAATIAGEANGSQRAYYGAAAVFCLTPAIIHVAHHRYERALISAAMRTVLPYLALHINDNSPGSDYDVRGPGPIIVATVVAALVDDLALSWAD